MMFWQPAPAAGTGNQQAAKTRSRERAAACLGHAGFCVYVSTSAWNLSSPTYMLSMRVLCACICMCVCVLRLRMFVLCAAAVAVAANCIFTLPFALFTWKLYWLWDWPLTLPEPRAPCHSWHAHGANWQRLVSSHRKVATSGSHV